MTEYYIPVGNWTNNVVSNVGNNPIDKLNYNISVDNQTEPAKECRKEFNAEYKCGKSSSTLKTLIVPPDARGRTALFDCDTEYKQCNDLKLVLTDNGKLTLTTLDGNKILWDSVTQFGETGKMPTSSIIIEAEQAAVPDNSNIFLSNPAYAANENTSNLVVSGAGRKYNTNYLLPGQILEIGQWIGSPTGTCRLIMKTDGLQVIANQLGCGGFDEETAPAAAATPAAAAAAANLANQSQLNQTITYSYKDLGCWKDTADRALKGGPKRYGYTVETCKQEAIERGSSIFALQNNGWCSTSDKTNKDDDYRKYGRSTDPCNPLGGGWQNHVYEIVEIKTQTQIPAASQVAPPVSNSILGAPSPAVDTLGARLYQIPSIHNENIGKVGYVNYLGQLQLFKANMTDYVDTYEEIGNYNIDGANLGAEFVSANVTDCQNTCTIKNSGTEIIIDASGVEKIVIVEDNAEKCAGFVFDTERKMCQLLDKNVYGSKRIIDPNYKFYMRGKGIINNHDSCSTETSNKPSTFWQSTTKSSLGDMSETSKCGLAKFTEEERDTVAYGKEVIMDDIDNVSDVENSFKSLFNNLKKKYKLLIGHITNTNTSIKTKFNELQNTKKDLADWTGEQLQNLEAMDDDTDLNMMSENYRHIMWSILAIIIIITTIKLTK
jgi:hypothetical protein